MVDLPKAAPVLALSLFVGCGGAQGTEPHDMSTAQHEASAGQEEATAAQHAEQYDPQALAKRARCYKGVPCWTSRSNPTREHDEAAAEHRELAQQHRAAAQALRDAEAQACAGLAGADRDMSPFYHREDIASVSKIEHEVARGNTRAGQIAGGRAVFRAVPEMTVEWLQRHGDCHMARAAALGQVVPEMSYCPLMVKGAKASVSSTGDGFAVEVTADDEQTAQEIWRRVQALVHIDG